VDIIDPGGHLSSEDVTLLLGQLCQGDKDAADRLIPLIYAELRRIARGYMQRERSDHTLQATALVHEAYMRLIDGQQGPWQNRAHFFATAAHTMRQILTDYARRRTARKRGGTTARKVSIDADLLVAPNQLEGLIAIDEALERLEAIDPRQGRLVELRFFAGLNEEEAALVMGISPVTVRREWRSAKAWLHREMTPKISE
jgi:RNA polymerase sigma-70 factor, ECF subfamily